ncbi:MAG: hypothetical protein HZA90_17685 [Verrucomicrobia bacterium]|nr:hypothetical protein [Verrucomicrobiota bacterium]
MKATPLLQTATLLAALLTLNPQPSTCLAAPLGTAFTYQGRLTDAGAPANGIFDLRLAICDSAGGSSPLAVTTNAAVTVASGLFAVTLDFGPEVFTGEARWLELGVRTNGSASDFTRLGPRQPLTPAPHALFAPNAGTAANLPASGLTGTVPDARLSTNVAMLNRPAAFSGAVMALGFFGGGVQLSNLNASQLAFGTVPDERLSERVALLNGAANFAGVVSAPGFAGSGFLLSNLNASKLAFGTVPEVRLGPNVALLNTNAAFNGSLSAAADLLADRLNIGAGHSLAGAKTAIAGGQSNAILSSADFSAIAGGANNTIEPNGDYSNVGGGRYNTLRDNANYAVIAGGYSNVIQTNISYAAIPGGSDNLVAGNYGFAAGRRAKAQHTGTFVWADSTDADFSSTATRQFLIRAAGGVGIGTNNPAGAALNVAGVVRAAGFEGPAGVGNTIDATADQAAVGGGFQNTVEDDADYSVIAGGSSNTVASGAAHGAILGGSQNAIRPDVVCAVIGGGRLNTNAGQYAVIAGGSGNEIQTSANYSTISGGSGNEIQADADYAVVGGGYANQIQYGANYAAIGGGSGNQITTNATVGVIAGGLSNAIREQAHHATIGGGFQNMIERLATDTFIGGGKLNLIQDDADFSVVAGGEENSVGSGAAHGAILGGAENAIQPDVSYATMGGGFANTNRGHYAVVAGGYANEIRADHAAISGGRDALAAHYGQWTHASGRFSQPGDAQSSLFVLRCATTNDVQKEMFLDNAGQRMTLPEGATWTFDILVSARNTTAASAGYELKGVIDNTGGDVHLIGPLSKTVLGEEVAGWDATAEADDTSHALVIKVTGSVGSTVRWVAAVRTAEVIQ